MIAFALAMLAQQGTAQAQSAAPTHADFSTDKDRTLAALHEVHLDVRQHLDKWGTKMAESGAAEKDGLRAASEAAKQQITTLDLAIRKVNAASEQEWAEVRKHALTTAQQAREALEKAAAGVKGK